jgi:hypothetical protein
MGLLCIASKHHGILPSIEDCALLLRMKADKAREVMTELAGHGLLDTDGTTWVPHNWNERQFVSDANDPTNAARQKRYRAKQAALRNGVTAVTDKRPETDTETERKILSVERGGSLATAPNGGALRSPPRKLSNLPNASPELVASLTKKGALQ